MVGKMPPPELMYKPDRERMANMPEEVDEESPSNGHVASSVADYMPARPGLRYASRHIYNIDKPVRIRSLTAREFDDIKLMDDQNLLPLVLVDADGKPAMAPEDLSGLMQSWEARTYIELLEFVNDHCLKSGVTLSTLVEGAAKN